MSAIEIKKGHLLAWSVDFMKLAKILSRKKVCLLCWEGQTLLQHDIAAIALYDFMEIFKDKAGNNGI